MDKRADGGPRVPPESYFSIFEFMSSRDGLGLKGAELNVYALVYSYSQGKGGCYYGSNAMTAHRAGCSERHAIDVIHSLEERGLVANVGERRLCGRVTNMYAADMAKVREAIDRCLGRSTPELPSGVGTGPCPEEISGVGVKPAQAAAEESSANSKEIPNAYERRGGACGGQPDAEGLDDAFRELVRCYPYTKDEAAARFLFEPLFAKGVRARHVAAVLGQWAKAHPAAGGRRPFYPELSRFLDENNPEGYSAYAAEAGRRAAAARAREARRLTADDYAADIYERYTADGCDRKASELFEAHLAGDGGQRGAGWDRWLQYMMLKRDVEARSHWLELKRAGKL